MSELKVVPPNPDEIIFIGVSKLVSHKDKPNNYRNEIRLDLSNNLSYDAYYDKDGLPTHQAVRPMEMSFIQGLVACVKMAADKKWMNAEMHTQIIMAELGKAFETIFIEEQEKEQQLIIQQ